MEKWNKFNLYNDPKTKGILFTEIDTREIYRIAFENGKIDLIRVVDIDNDFISVLSIKDIDYYKINYRTFVKLWKIGKIYDLDIKVDTKDSWNKIKIYNDPTTEKNLITEIDTREIFNVLYDNGVQDLIKIEKVNVSLSNVYSINVYSIKDRKSYKMLYNTFKSLWKNEKIKSLDMLETIEKTDFLLVK